jgi:hypothetical protein
VSTINPFKKTPAAPLVDQLAAKQAELEATAGDEAASAKDFARYAAEAQAASDLATKQALAVNEAHHILHAAGVSL